LDRVVAVKNAIQFEERLSIAVPTGSARAVHGQDGDYEQRRKRSAY
jgi:hypothetical protein